MKTHENKTPKTNARNSLHEHTLHDHTLHGKDEETYIQWIREPVGLITVRGRQYIVMREGNARVAV